MPTTRSSARLAKAKPAKVEPAVKDVDTSAPSKPDSEYNESDDDDKAPTRKRPCTTKKSVVAVKKRPVRGRQGRLAGLMNMPIDIFTEIASYLFPHDIIVLSRSNKFFRNLLLNRASTHIWLSTTRNVNGLPSCPPDLSLPRYLTLLFSKFCSTCGSSAPRRMDETLLVRFCHTCRKECVMPLYRAPIDIIGLLHRSSHILPSKRRSGNEPHVLRTEVDEVNAKFAELQQAGDTDAMNAWKAERRQQVEERAERAPDISRFLDDVENERGNQLLTVKQERRLEIERRLRELGWENEDMKFQYFSPSRRAWCALVEQPRLITDRIWQNLRDKLIPLLESNREERLEREKTGRQTMRRERLIQLLSQIKSTAPPVLQFSVRPPTTPSVSSLSASPNVVRYAGIFPDYVDALEWPVVKELYEADTDATQFAVGFEQHRAEINVQIAEWKTTVETHMAGLVREGRPAQIKGDIIKPALVVETNPFADISDNLKTLLRADSFFQPVRSGAPLVFDAAVATGYIHTTNTASFRPIKNRLDLARMKRYDEAQEAARILLESLGKPDACYLEMRSVGQRYSCGRCHDRRLRTWEEMVQHYISEKQAWTRLESELATLKKAGITYNNVHNPARISDRPLIQYVSSQLEVDLVDMPGGMASSKGCKLCIQAPIRLDVHGSEGQILIHLREVHSIAKPKVREHYDNYFAVGAMGILDGYDFDMFHELYDDFYDEEPMWGYDSDEDYLWGW